MIDNVQSSTFKIPHLVIVKAPGLLPMHYTPREIAEELGIPESTLRDWILRGAPHFRDDHNHLWINGQKFAAWVEDLRNAKNHRARRRRRILHALQPNRKNGRSGCAAYQRTTVPLERAMPKLWVRDQSRRQVW